MKGLKINLEYLKFIFNNVDFSIADHEFIYNELGEPIDYKYLYANKVFCESLSIPLEKLIGKTVFEVFPDTEQYWIDKYYEVVRTGTPLTMTRFAKQFGLYFSVYAYKSGDNSFMVSFKDVTEILKHTQIEETSKKIKKVAFNVSKIGFFEVNRLTLRADVSDLFNTVVGLGKIEEGFFRRTLLKLTHPEDFDTISNMIKDVVNGDLKELDVEFRMFNQRENRYHWMNFFVFAIEYDKDNIPFRYTGLVRDIEEEKRKQEETLEAEELFKEARRVADLTTFIYDVSTEKFDASIELDNFTGVKNLTVIDQFRKIVHPEDLEIYDEATRYTLKNALGKVTIYRIIKDEEIKYIQSSVFGKVDKSGNSTKVFGILKDITEIERARRFAIRNRKSFELIYNTSPSGIFLLDSKFKLTMENQTFRDMFDIRKNEVTLSDLLKDFYDDIIISLKENEAAHHININHLIKGVTKNFVINIVKIGDDFINNYQGTVVDITQQVVDKERIEYLATHDILTDLYNRNYFEEIVVKKKKDYPLGLIMCDIDGLKLVNDAFGHLKGDKLLKVFSKGLKNLSDKFIISRSGGDEFTILVDNATEEELEKIEQDIQKTIGEINQFEIDFGVSVGYAVLDGEHSEFNRVFNKAENMMYRRKLTERSSRKSNALSTIMQTLHEKTEETKNHCERVGDYSSMLLFEVGYKRIVDLDDIT